MIHESLLTLAAAKVVCQFSTPPVELAACTGRRSRSEYDPELSLRTNPLPPMTVPILHTLSFSCMSRKTGSYKSHVVRACIIGSRPASYKLSTTGFLVLERYVIPNHGCVTGYVN